MVQLTPHGVNLDQRDTGGRKELADELLPFFPLRQ